MFGGPESRRMTVSVVLRNVGGRAVRVHTMEQTRGCPGDVDSRKEKLQLIASRGWGTGSVPGLLAAVSHVYLSPPLPRLRDFDGAPTLRLRLSIGRSCERFLTVEANMDTWASNRTE